MPPDLNPTAHVWVALDVVAEALNVTAKAARKIAAQENIRTSTTRPAQYLWADVVRTHRHRTGATP